MKDKLISNRQVIKAILHNKELFRFPEDIQRFAVIIEDLPSMNELQGEWIRTTFTDHGAPIDECSECGYHVNGDMEVRNFCPNCGVYMKGKDDEKECHKPESEYYRAYCEEQKEKTYCEGCKFWY